MDSSPIKRRTLARHPNVKFFIRLFSKEDVNGMKHFTVDQNEKTIFVRALQDLERPDPRGTYWQFNTDGVFIDKDQSDFYSAVVGPQLQYAKKGTNILFIGFGEPNAGKTYSFSGLLKSHQDRGLIPRALEELHQIKTEETEYNIKMGVTYVEFVNNVCRNLLTRKPQITKMNQIEPIGFETLSDGLNALFLGEMVRHIDNTETPHGTVVFTVHITCTATNAKSANIMSSKIHFVEIPSIGNPHALIRPFSRTTSANKDKLNMDVASHWSYNMQNRPKRPVKKSKKFLPPASNLMKYISTSFPDGVVTLLGFIRPENHEIQLMLSTLRFGCKIARLHIGELIFNNKTNVKYRMDVLQSEITALEEFNRCSQLIRSAGFTPQNVHCADINYIERVVNTYLDSPVPSKSPENNPFSVAKPHLVFEMIRKTYMSKFRKTEVSAEYASLDGSAKSLSTYSNRRRSGKRSKRESPSEILIESDSHHHVSILKNAVTSTHKILPTPAETKEEIHRKNLKEFSTLEGIKVTANNELVGLRSALARIRNSLCDVDCLSKYSAAAESEDFVTRSNNLKANEKEVSENINRRIQQVVNAHVSLGKVRLKIEKSEELVKKERSITSVGIVPRSV